MTDPSLLMMPKLIVELRLARNCYGGFDLWAARVSYDQAWSAAVTLGQAWCRVARQACQVLASHENKQTTWCCLKIVSSSSAPGSGLQLWSWWCSTVYLMCAVQQHAGRLRISIGGQAHNQEQKSTVRWTMLQPSDSANSTRPAGQTLQGYSPRV